MKSRFVFCTLVVAIVAVMSAPFAVRAQTADQLRAQIADILAQINALRSQLQQSTVTPTVPTPQVPIVPSAGGTPITPTVGSQNGLATFQYSRCPDLQFNLERGMRDRDVAVEVTMLQRFFAQDRSLYPSGEVTGYFGPATERAVQTFQERHGIVARGDYKSTGYGRVGPRTRWAIKNSCGTTTTHAFTVSPTSGPVPFKANVSFDFRGLSCTSYRLDWGDGSTPLVYQAPPGVECSKDVVRKDATHTYVTPGTYVVTLHLGKGALDTLPIIGRANVVVQHGSVQTGSRATMAVTPTKGNAPFTAHVTINSDTPSACTSYEIDWGDGTQPARREAGTSVCTTRDTFTRQFTHTYQNAGTYTIKARAGRGLLQQLGIMSRQVNVSGQPASGTSCFITPTNGAAPLAAKARILFGGTLCDGSLTYSIDWGDGNVMPWRTCSDRNSHFEEFTHSYTTPGVYTARLNQSHPNARFAEQVCTINVTQATATGGGGIIPSSCRRWTDGCNTCGRDYAGGPARCTQLHCIQPGQRQCYEYFGSGNSGITTGSDSLTYRTLNSGTRTIEFTALINTARDCNGGVYTIYFGDANDSLQPYPADACQLFTRTVTHTYSQNGTYTALLLKNGATVDQVTVVVGGTSNAAGNNVASVFHAIESFIRALFK